MQITVTLITAPQNDGLAAALERVTAGLKDVGCAALHMTWLSVNEAVDITVEAMSPAAIRGVVNKALAELPVDAIVQPAAGRQKRLLVADMESTIIEQEMLEEMADVLDKRAAVTDITRRAMNGELDFAAALQQRVALFAGQPAALLGDMAARITLMPGATTLLTTMKRHGATCWLASGGFRFYTRQVAARLGFDRDFANDLLIEHGQLTGTVAAPILDKHSKLQILQQGAAEQGLSLADTLTVGDGANDLPMLQASSDADGLGIAFRAKPTVQAAATHIINHGDLTALLFAQGYKREEFIVS